MADFLAGWLAGGQTRDRNFAAEDEISNAIIKANYARQQEERAAQERIARARNLSPMAQQGNQAAQMELGLATVYGIINQNKGFIEVESTPSVGTSFFIYLPRHGAKAAPLKRKESASGTLSGQETILVSGGRTRQF